MTTPGDTTDATPLRSLWRNRSFNLLWGSQTLSELGSAMSSLAMPLLVLALTGSALQAGVLGTVSAIVRTAVRLPSGVLADRWHRKRTMLTCDAIRLAAYAALAVLIASGHATMPALYAVAIIEALTGVLFDTNEQSSLRNIVPAVQLPAAMARNEARGAASGLAGPPIGGALFGLGRALPFLADAVTFVLSFIGISLIRDRLQEERAEKPAKAMAALGEGIRFVLAEPFLRAVLLIAAPINFAYTGLLFAIILLLQRAGTPPALIGTVDTIVGVGGLIGALLAPALMRLLKARTLMIAIGWAGVVLAATSSWLTGSLLVVVPVALSLMLGPAVNSALFGYQSAITPDRLQGRVMSIIMFTAMSLSTFAPLLAGVLVQHVTGRVTVLVFTGFMAVGAVAVTTSRGVRSMRPLAELTATTETAGAESSA